MSVKRYDMKEVFKGRMAVVETSAGVFVTHGDYAVLEQKLTDLAVQLANAESKCRDLAAENLTMNDKMNKLATWPGIEFYSSAWEFCNLDGNDALEFMCDVKTPATDAFLAEVRAQGVDSSIETLVIHLNHQYQPIASAIHFLKIHADQLRQEAAQ